MVGRWAKVLLNVPRAKLYRYPTAKKWLDSLRRPEAVEGHSLRGLPLAVAAQRQYVRRIRIAREWPERRRRLTAKGGRAIRCAGQGSDRRRRTLQTFAIWKSEDIALRLAEFPDWPYRPDAKGKGKGSGSGDLSLRHEWQAQLQPVPPYAGVHLVARHALVVLRPGGRAPLRCG